MSLASALVRKYGIAPEEEEFFLIVAEHFDAAHYLETYKDGAKAGLDPLEHWLNSGVRDGRQISRSLDLRYGKIARRSSSRIWRHYHWRGQDIAVRLSRPIPSEVMTQIFNQARHDSAVLAGGVGNIAKLFRQDRENVHVDVAGLRHAIPHDLECLLVVPNLDIGGDQGLTTELVAALSDAGFRSIQTIVVDEEGPKGLDKPTIPGPFRKTKILFWQDFWIHGPEAVKLGQLVQLVRALRPRVTIVANSRQGYEMIARFGRGLSESTKIYCTYTNGGEVRDFAARFSSQTLRFATALTDDVVLAATLREQYGDALRHGVVVLPRHSPAAFLRAVTDLFART